MARRGIYTTTVQQLHDTQGMLGVMKHLRSQNAAGCADVLLWALDHNHIDIARQAYQKVSNTTKWQLAQNLARRTQHHRAFPMILGGQDPSYKNAELLWLAASSGNRETVRFLVRHPKITPVMCMSKSHSQKACALVEEELSVWQSMQLKAAVGTDKQATVKARKI